MGSNDYNDFFRSSCSNEYFQSQNKNGYLNASNSLHLDYAKSIHPSSSKPLQNMFVNNKFMPYHSRGTFYLAKAIYLYVQ